MPIATLKSCDVHYSDLSSDTGATFSTWRGTATKTIVFIHGLGSTQNFYYPLIPLLKPGYRCILLDLPNSGRSSLNKEGETTVEGLAKTVFELLDHIKVLGSVTVVGHSMGCLVALHAAQLFADRVEGLVLFGPVYPSEKLAEVFESRIATVWMGGMESMANTIPNAAVGSNATTLQKAFIRELLLGQTVDGYSAMCKCIAVSTVGDLKQVKAKVLIVAGEEDKSAPLEGCKKFDDELEDLARLQKVANVGHWHVVEAPEKMAELVEDFLGL